MAPVSISGKPAVGGLQMRLDDALDESIRLTEASLLRPDFREGVASFVEKRSPDFRPLGA